MRNKEYGASRVDQGAIIKSATGLRAIRGGGVRVPLILHVYNNVQSTIHTLIRVCISVKCMYMYTYVKQTHVYIYVDLLVQVERYVVYRIVCWNVRCTYTHTYE